HKAPAGVDVQGCLESAVAVAQQHAPRGDEVGAAVAVDVRPRQRSGGRDSDGRAEGAVGVFKEHLRQTMTDAREGLGAWRHVVVARGALLPRVTSTSCFSLPWVARWAPLLPVVIARHAVAQTVGGNAGAGVSITSIPKARAFLYSDFTCCSRTRASYSS